MKKIALVIAIVMLTGCAALDIASILIDDPKPVPIAPICGPDTVGVSYQGETCLKWTDGRYRWAKERSSIDWDQFRIDLEIASLEAVKRANKALAAKEARLIERQNAEIAEIWKAVKMLP